MPEWMQQTYLWPWISCFSCVGLCKARIGLGNACCAQFELMRLAARRWSFFGRRDWLIPAGKSPVLLCAGIVRGVKSPGLQLCSYSFPLCPQKDLNLEHSVLGCLSVRPVAAALGSAPACTWLVSWADLLGWVCTSSQGLGVGL